MSTDLHDRLRAELTRVAGEAPVPMLPDGPGYRARAHGRSRLARARRLVPAMPALASAAVVLLVVVAVVVITGRPNGIPAAKGGPASWPARGSLAGDTSFIDTAMRTWDAALVPSQELPHRDVHVLFAEHTVAGNVVVLTGFDALGHRRIAELSTDATSTTPFRHRLHLIADVFAPTGDGAGLIAIDAPHNTPRKTQDELLVVIAAPGTVGLQWRDQTTHWQPVHAVDGAGALVHVMTNQSTTVRAGRDGDGVQPLGEFLPMWTGYGQQIWHDLADSERPKRPNTNESCSGNVCESSSGSASATISANPKDGNWTSLLAAGSMAWSDWQEYAGEVRLYAESTLTSDWSTWSSTWSGVLTDGTGIDLEHYSGGADPGHLLVYVDRPEWNGGSIVDVVPTSSVMPALAVTVPTPAGQSLDVVYADGYRVQWRIGGGAWHDLSGRNHVASVVVPTTAGLTWRALDATGSVVDSGPPHAVNPRV